MSVKSVYSTGVIWMSPEHLHDNELNLCYYDSEEIEDHPEMSGFNRQLFADYLLEICEGKQACFVTDFDHSVFFNSDFLLDEIEQRNEYYLFA